MSKDSEIAGRIRKGDKTEFESLFRSYYVSLVNYAKTLVRDHDTAEEIVQDLFVRIWQNKEKFKIKSSLNGYLFRSVHNRCIHNIEHLKVVSRHAETETMHYDNSVEDPSEILQYKDLQLRIARTLKRLPERSAEIFCMSRFDGLKYNEIAEKLSVSVKTVEVSMGRALKEFRKELLEQ